MLLSLVTGAVGILNASAFLLMSAGPKLLEYIVVSSVFSLAASLYSWILPAAVGYRAEKLPLLRLLQFTTVAVASAVILWSHPTGIGVTFVLMMVADVIIFPAAILLFRSETALFLRMELVRGVANSAALLVVLSTLHSDPQAYAMLCLCNVVVAGLALAATGVHRPPSLHVAPLSALRFLYGRAFWTSQLRLLLAARALETGGLLLLGRFGSLSHVLSLKIAMAISSALVVNARARSSMTLVAAHVGVYVVGTVGILVVSGQQMIPVPPTLRLIDPLNALLVLPLALLAFALSIRSLRISKAVTTEPASEVGEA